jgi:hypothetical protein
MATDVATINRLPAVEERKQVPGEKVEIPSAQQIVSRLEDNRDKGRILVTGENNAADVNTPMTRPTLMMAAELHGRI